MERLSALHPDQFKLIEDCFDEAFADYALKGKSARLWLRDRSAKNGVDLAASAAAWDGDRMVGFTLVGLDEEGDVSSAYDSGTGIVPSHRGRGLAGRIFDFLLPELTCRGVKRFLLEVLQENEPAVAAYRKAGFETAREFDCFALKEGDFSRVKALGEINVLPMNREQAIEMHRKSAWPPSWENSASSIARIPGELVVLGAQLNGELAGELIYHPESQWLHSLFVDPEHRRRGLASALLEALMEGAAKGSSPKAVNVDRRDTAFAAFLENAGFELFTRQFEMERLI